MTHDHKQELAEVIRAFVHKNGNPTAMLPSLVRLNAHDLTVLAHAVNTAKSFARLSGDHGEDWISGK
jgi:hypothetical protein